MVVAWAATRGILLTHRLRSARENDGEDEHGGDDQTGDGPRRHLMSAGVRDGGRAPLSEQPSRRLGAPSANFPFGSWLGSWLEPREPLTRSVLVRFELNMIALYYS